MVGFWVLFSFGPAMAAKSRGIPVFIHEANRAVGKAVRFLAKIKTLYLPEGMHLEGISPEVIRNMGYPLRREFRRIPKERARKQLGFQFTSVSLLLLW